MNKKFLLPFSIFFLVSSVLYFFIFSFMPVYGGSCEVGHGCLTFDECSSLCGLEDMESDCTGGGTLCEIGLCCCICESATTSTSTSIVTTTTTRVTTTTLTSTTTTIPPNCKILIDKYSAAFGATCTDPRWTQNNNYVADVVRDQKIDFRDGGLIGQNAGNDAWCLDKLNLPDSCLASTTTTTTIPIGSCTGTISSCATWQDEDDRDNCDYCLCYYTSTCRDPGTRDCSQISDETECRFCGCNWSA